MPVAPRIYFNGEPGTYWVNETGFVQYQAIASLKDTCGVCLQNHHVISRWWGFPFHDECDCHQIVVKRGARAPHPFVSYRELLDLMERDQQDKALGVGGYPLLRSGMIVWEDIVTKTRVRSLAEVVARKRLTIAQMVEAGVPPDTAFSAYAEVHTPEADAMEEERRELSRIIGAAGTSRGRLLEELGKRLATKVNPGAKPDSRTDVNWRFYSGK